MRAPQAVINVGTTVASCGTTSLIAFNTTLCGFAAASTPTAATTARTPSGVVGIKRDVCLR
jgi:hypothetical protein